ncbi:MAG: EutN/CcmL family microcompartment protein [Christensenellales bacterium]|uniref:EutN/CcmL family microcompartment protein n=1 Tax=Candidatus Avichristensenella intestinipullorum TaxID=2840693 RepID=A0A9D0YX23_9FIRM|nr:EutN/CcmL family microcompartment protein [Christensenellales bacterium]HIQ63677.1 EutN/CcmL family microcompartment protein [Candidatus Avichristensenella intestinipullorum]
MIIAKVVGNLWATRKEESLVGRKLMMVQPASLEGDVQGECFVAVDTIDAGVGEMVLVAQGSSARKSLGQTDSPVDAAIVAIIDIHEVKRGGGA